MKKPFNYDKEKSRGIIKQIMKVRGLRSISFANYLKWLYGNSSGKIPFDIHSLKIDIQDGYINAYKYDKNGKCGEKIEDATTEQYSVALDLVKNILETENTIPFKVKRNILVKLSR